MFRTWLAAHRSLVVSATSASAIVALIATVAIVSTGYTAQHLALGDGAVWVTNNVRHALGRANPEVLALNSVVQSTGSNLDVVQRGKTVLLVDHIDAKLDIIDPATSTIADSVALPPNQPAVFLAGDHVVVVERGTGKLWVVQSSELKSFDSQATTTLNLGANALVSVDPNGWLVAYSPSTGFVYEMDAAHSDTVESTENSGVPANATNLSITSVNHRWALLDSGALKLYLRGSIVDLTSVVGTGSTPVLQTASAAGDQLLIGYSAGLLSVPVGGGEVRAIVTGKSGNAAAPFLLAGCVYAAWTDGQNWRRCAGDQAAGVVFTLGGMAGTALLTYQSNGDRAVLNDRRSGATWAVQRSGELIDNWSDLITAQNSHPQDQQNDPTVIPQVDKVQEPPVAVNDEFGARPGRSTVLPVLLNDYDPNGDVLVVSDTSAIDASVGHIDLINQRQQIQLTLESGASGQVRFTYTITDGRGGSASATVIVTIKTPNQNSPPVQVRQTKTVVQAGARVTTQVLSDWVDPEGDPFYLTSASISAPDAVTYKPDGTVVYSDSGSGGDLKIISLVVSDGQAAGAGTLSISVKQAGNVPIIADPFELLAYAGEELTVSPLDHVRGGSGPLRLNSVPSKADITVTPSYESGTFRFVSDALRSHYIDYAVTDGIQTVTGTVRIDVEAPPDANTKPITVPKTVFVQTLSNERVDVAGTDVDPAGGVLLVTGILNLPSNSGVRAEVLDQRIVRVSLDKPLDNGPVSFNYRITNGLSEAQGVITVIQIPTPARLQPPVANDDSVTVRVGQTIDIPVLNNDEQPDGLDLTLQPALFQDLPPNSGLLFASGRVLRYLAPNKSGNFTAAYRVTGPDGQAATAFVHIAVREADSATNNPPVPVTVTARVIAGETVRVAIPLTGIDPNGDSVQLLGQSSNPQKGSVTSVESDALVYKAGEYSAGTDSFTYAVIDSLGARATGTVRIGISPTQDAASNPVAIIDAVTARPGVSVSVRVLVNDSDPEGRPLTVTTAVPTDSVTTARIMGDVVVVTPPPTPGNYGVIYTIENDKGGTSQNFIRVTVDPNAPRSRPVASDTVLTLSDIQGREKVTVNVLAHVFFADGDDRSVVLSIYPGYTNVATVTESKNVEVSVAAKSQIIPFKVANPDDLTAFTYAFIRVPGRDDGLPQLDTRAPALKVVSGDQLVVALNDYVIAVGGKQIRLTDSSTVQATHSDGTNLVRDDRTLVFTSADKYFGPASISFEVTDGTSSTDLNGNKSVLVLPITVVPRVNQPPSFIGAVISFEPGEQKVIDLLKLTSYPYPNDLGQLVYSVLNPLPVGFSYTLDGSTLTLKADSKAVKNSTTAMSLAVKDDRSTGQAGRIDLTVVPSTRPLASPASDSAIVTRGTSVSVDVLANDQATNPFPGQPLTVVAIRGLDGASVPPGVVLTPSADKSAVTATVAQTATPGSVTLQYQVADATNDPDRYVWGTITISVQDRPDPVSNIAPTGFSDRQVSLRYNAGSFNNSPITNYRVTATHAGTVVDTENCAGTTCTITTGGNGPANSVTVTVVATNAIGDSDPVTLSDPIWSDTIPPAPATVTAQPLDHGLLISWDAVTAPSGGSPVDRYYVSVGGFSGDFAAGVCTGGTCTISTLAAGWSLDNGTAVSFTISPRNAALTALSAWNSSDPRSGVPAGAPIALAAPLGTALSDTAVHFDWASVFSANGRPITQYTAAAYTGLAPTCAADGTIASNGATIAGPLTGTSTDFSGLSPNGAYSLIVFAYNGQGCTQSSAVVAHTAPGVITALVFGGPDANGDHHWDISVTGGAMGADALTDDFTIIYVLSGGTVQGGESGPVSLSSPLTASGSQYGQQVTVQARACRTYDSVPVCQSQLSSPIATNRVPVDNTVSTLTFTPADPALDPNGLAGSFDWLGWPSGSYQNIQYRCDGQAGFTDAVTNAPGHCDASGTVPQGALHLTVRVIANSGQTYDFTYSSQ